MTDRTPHSGGNRQRFWRLVLRYLERGVRYRANRECGDESIAKGREPVQMGWYAHAASVVSGARVLDVGCGMGAGLCLLDAVATEAIGIDVDPRLARDDSIVVEIRDITSIPDKAFDAVVCIDVLEHIENDAAFVAQLARVARRCVYLSTPNYSRSFNQWPYHVREYTPRQLERLLAPYGRAEVFGGSSDGEQRAEITNRWLYYLICDLYCYKGVHWLAKIVRRVSRTRIWPHQALVIHFPA